MSVRHGTRQSAKSHYFIAFVFGLLVLVLTGFAWAGLSMTEVLSVAARH